MARNNDVNRSLNKNKRDKREKAFSNRPQMDEGPIADMSAALGAEEKKEAVRKNYRNAKKRAGNDPAWYKFNDQIYNESGKLNYLYKIGMPLKGNTQVGSGQLNSVLPSAICFKFAPMPGDTVEGVSAPVNQAAIAFYRAMQRRVQKELPFAPCDLTIFFMCMDSVYMMYSWLCRLYALNCTYMSINPTLPRVLFKAMGLDTTNDAYIQDLGWEDFKKRLDAFCISLNNVRCPKFIKMMDRHSWLTSNVFKDSPNDKAGCYIFTPSHCYIYENSGSPLGAYANLHYIDSSEINTLRNAMNFVTNMWEKIRLDENFNTIQAWLGRAYDESEFKGMAMLAPTAYCDPIYVGEVLPQIHNMDICGAIVLTDGLGDITQTSRDVVQQRIQLNQLGKKAFGNIYTSANNKRLLDQPMDNPSIDANYVATRFKITTKLDSYIEDGGNRYIDAEFYGTEIIGSATIWEGVPNTGEFRSFTLYSNSIPCNNDSSLTASLTDVTPQDMQTYAKWLHFFCSPMLVLTNDGGADPTDFPAWFDVLGDVTNITMISRDDIQQLHSAAVMGEWLNPADFLS
jgi:hypothetical protein